MANRISQLRKSIGLSQVDLAKKMGVGQSTISNWESEKTTIDSESLTKLSKLLIASAGYILGIEDGPYNGLSEQQYQSMCEEKHDEAEAEAIINEYEREESAIALSASMRSGRMPETPDISNPLRLGSCASLSPKKSVSGSFRWLSSCSLTQFTSLRTNLDIQKKRRVQW